MRRLARWIVWNVPLPSWILPHVIALALGTRRYGRVDNPVETVEKSPRGRDGEARG